MIAVKKLKLPDVEPVLRWTPIIMLAVITLAASVLAWVLGDPHRGIVVETEATWVHPRYTGNVTRSGQIWQGHAYQAATKSDHDLGRWKRVRVAGTHGPVVYVLVTDRLPASSTAGIDLSEGAVRLLGEHLLKRGRFPVIVEDAR